MPEPRECRDLHASIIRIYLSLFVPNFLLIETNEERAKDLSSYYPL